MTTALDQIPTLTARLRHIQPDLAADLDRIEHTAGQLTHWLPRARQLTERGDGLRSRSLEPHRGSSGHADPTGRLVASGWADTGRTRRGHAGKLDQAADHIRTAHLDLTHAVRAIGPPNQGDAPPEAAAGELSHPRPAQPTPDVADHVRDAKVGLDKALGLVQATMPKTYNRRDVPPWPACTNCHTHGHQSPAAPDRGGLCWWCADVRRALGDLPDAELAEKHQAGRILKRAYDAFEERKRKRRAKARAKAKAGRR